MIIFSQMKSPTFMTQSEINNLQIGNIICTDKAYWLVKNISFNSNFPPQKEIVAVEIQPNESGGFQETKTLFDNANAANLSGILLRPFIFPSLGFVNNKKGIHSLVHSHGFHWDIFVHPQLGNPVKLNNRVQYLHELQNFFNSHSTERVEFPIIYL